MPLYEYECPRGHITEKMAQTFASAPATIVCEHVDVEDVSFTGVDVARERRCVATAERRQFSVGNWQFGEGKKGSPVGEAIKRVKARGL